MSIEKTIRDPLKGANQKTAFFDRAPLETGECFPLGSTLYPTGTNFSIFCKNGTSVELLFFDYAEDIDPSRVISLDPDRNRTYHYWHAFVPGIEKNQLYAYRINGPFEPWNGYRYDPDKVLLDPYARMVVVPDGYDRSCLSVRGPVSCPGMKSVVTDLSSYDWEGDQRMKRPFTQTIIYEMHVKGFTRHPDSGLDSGRAGTYRGIIEKIPYLVDLGITAVELLPVFQFDKQDCPTGLVNYWGYAPISLFAPHYEYASEKEPGNVLDEFRDMVKAFHRAGIEVILDVVFNHTAEGNHEGPTLSFRGIDNGIYYILENDKNYYSNFSGTGNTFNANHPIVRRMIIDSLHFWVTEMHVDGFRFDLASILSRDENGIPVENPPVLWDIETDPMLAGVKLIAEAWDAAGLYQVGHFIGDSWKEWNGRFRDDIRKFVKGDLGTISSLVTRLVGSPDIFGHEEREAEQSINFVTCHDGFTLNDLVSYNSKHNEANHENNQDGNNDNLSWNCGVEGPTDNSEIDAIRNQQVKNFLTLTLLSIGAPMLLMGDELRRTQGGNNNAYCQDNEISWFDWGLMDRHQDIYRFTKFLIKSRLQRDTSRTEFSMSLNELLAQGNITWHGVKLHQPDWSYHSQSIAFTIRSIGGNITMHYMISAYYEPLVFELPKSNRSLGWHRWIDTSMESPLDIVDWENAELYEKEIYTLPPRSIAVLISGN